ncbi:hypothetical protein CHU98_g905 [Xylaria longipes]|nr:hypothetical protein CHU98_g905 [Xylaria longipes]
MQALWSRAAQAQSSCRCRICLHSANALTRRATTAAPRRKITVADVFTACYTTILGTATIIDARRKKERRRELDGALDRARASLHQLAVGSPQSALDGDHGALDGETSTTSQLVRDITSRSASEPARPLLEELQSLYDIAYQPVARPSWISDQFDWSIIEAAVAVEDQDPNTVLLEPRTAGDLAETTDTVLDLVDELLRRTETHPSRRPQDKTDIPDLTGDGILEELEYLRQGCDFPSYKPPHTDPSYSTHIRALLNESIRLIFDQALSSRETVGRICYNLLTVGVPPTIHTYNTLIIGFNRIQRQDLAEAVINSYLCRTSWPATDQTVICLLAHYRRPGGQEGMRDAVQRIWGGRVHGLRLAAPDGDLHEIPLTVERRHRLQRGKGTLLVNRNDATFDHLIRGWLYHGEMGFACMSFVSCLRNRSYIPIYTLQELFRGCLATADFAAARKLLAGIIRNFTNFQWYLSKSIRGHSTVAVQELLRSLCQIINICWLPFGEIFGRTYQTYELAAKSLKAMISRLDVQLEIRETARLPALISDALSSDESLLTRLELAISSLDTVKLVGRTPAIFEDAYIRIARVLSIDRRCRDLEEGTQNLIAAYKGAIISIKTGYDIDLKSRLLSGRNTRAQQDKVHALRRAISQLNVPGGSLTSEEVASQLFRRIPNQELIRQLEEYGNWKRLSIPVLVSFFGDNAASRPGIECEEDELNHPYEHLNDQFREATDSIRALIFTHLTAKTQRRNMSHYRGYYSIPLHILRKHLNREMKYCLPLVLQDSAQYGRLTATCNTPEPLLQPGLEEPTIQDHSIPIEADGSTSDMKDDPFKGWGKARSHQEYGDLSVLREEDPRLQHTALG